MRKYTIEVITTDDISFRNIEWCLDEVAKEVEMLEIEEVYEDD